MNHWEKRRQDEPWVFDWYEFKRQARYGPLLHLRTLQSSCFLPLLWVSSQGCGSTGVGSCWKGQLPRTADAHLFFLVMGAQGAWKDVPGTQDPGRPGMMLKEWPQMWRGQQPPALAQAWGEQAHCVRCNESSRGFALQRTTGRQTLSIEFRDMGSRVSRHMSLTESLPLWDMSRIHLESSHKVTVTLKQFTPQNHCSPKNYYTELEREVRW